MSDSRQDRGDRRQEPAFCNETFYFQLLDYWIIRLQKIILANCKDTDYYKAESILVETVYTYLGDKSERFGESWLLRPTTTDTQQMCLMFNLCKILVILV